MRLASFRHEATREWRIGVVQGEVIRPLLDTGPHAMLERIRAGASNWEPGNEEVPLDTVTLLAPIPVPVANIICLGRNYAEHSGEMMRAGREITERPTFFTKAVTSVIGPYDDIPYDASLSTELDWECELAFVIGRRARHVSREEALGHVFGYLVLNDVSARDLQYGFGGQFFYGKSLNGTCPMGPWIVTADEIDDPQALNLRLTVNGQEKQHASTADMIVGVAETIAILSRAMTLEAGQIISTGAPAGVGFARNPKEFLHPEDLMRSEIDRIGVLENRVVSAEP